MENNPNDFQFFLVFLKYIVAGLDYRISAATIFVVCVAYSSMVQT